MKKKVSKPRSRNDGDIVNQQDGCEIASQNYTSWREPRRRHNIDTTEGGYDGDLAKPRTVD